MSGTNYISVAQITESEKKLHLMSVMKSVSSSNVSISLSDFISGCQVELEDADPRQGNLDNTLPLLSSATSKWLWWLCFEQ